MRKPSALRKELTKMAITNRTAIMAAVAFLLLVCLMGRSHGQEIDAGAVEAPAATGTELMEPEALEEAPAAEPTPAEQAEADPVGVATDVVNDVKAGDWRHAVAGMLALLMLALGKVRGKIKYFDGDRGGAILVGVLGMAGAISTLLVSEAALDWRLFAGAFATVFTAVGGYTWIKRLIWPKDKKAEDLIGGS
jgi:hypothetical protein